MNENACEALCSLARLCSYLSGKLKEETFRADTNARMLKRTLDDPDERVLKCRALSAFEAFVDRVVMWTGDCPVDDSLLGDLQALAREARETIRGIRTREPPTVS